MRLPSRKDIKSTIRRWFVTTPKEVVDKVRGQNGEAYVKIGDKRVKPEDEEKLDELVNMDDGDIDYDYPIPDDVGEFMVSDDATVDEEAYAIANMQDHDIEREPTDDWIKYSMGESGRPNIQPQSKDTLPLDNSYEDAIYPEGGHSKNKCNIEAIKEWVETVKLAGASDDEIEEEYYHWRENEEYQQFQKVDKNMQNLVSQMKTRGRDPETTKKLLIDSVAYMVARKIWYAGRKPKGMIDFDWDKLTRYMRPQEGSFGGGDVWVNFKYGENYMYESGEYKIGRGR